MITVVRVEDIKLIRSIVRDKNYQWVYLGKDVLKRNKIANEIGRENRIFIGDLFTKTAERLRQPFLNFLSEMSSYQQDDFGWWVSKFCGRNTYSSDFFFLLCYQSVFFEICKKKPDVDMAIVVENPWLYNQLQKKDKPFKLRLEISFLSSRNLLASKILILLRSILSRAKFILKSIISWILTRRYYGSSLPPAAGENAIAIFSYLQKRSLIRGAGWHDFYTTSLFDLLISNNFQVFRFTSPEITGFEKDVAERKNFLYPIMNLLSLSDILKAALYIWRPTFDKKKKLIVEGLRVDILVQAEIWKEYHDASQCIWKLNYLAMKKFFKKRLCNKVVFPYENLAIDKTLCLAAREAGGVKTVGYQHNVVSRFALPFFLGIGEAQKMPLPDKVLTTGRLGLDILALAGVPVERLRVGGAWRYLYLLGETKTFREKQGNCSILVCLPNDQKQVVSLLSILMEKFSNSGSPDFYLKFHPTDSSAKHFDIDKFPCFHIVEGGLKDLVGKIAPSCILYVGSTVGVELALQGHRVVQYLPETFIGHDPIDLLPSHMYVKCNDLDIEEVLKKCTTSKNQVPPKDNRHRKYANAIWGEINEQVWLEELRN